MNPHIRIMEELFSAARSEFKHMEYFYFHNCMYESVWRDNKRRHSNAISTWDVLHTYPHDYKVIIVGDASMSPYEIVMPGGSVEHWNEEPGAIWLQRLLQVYPKTVWINPLKPDYWEYTQSISMIRDLVEDRMYSLTLSGLESAMRELVR